MESTSSERDGKEARTWYRQICEQTLDASVNTQLCQCLHNWLKSSSTSEEPLPPTYSKDAPRNHLLISSHALSPHIDAGWLVGHLSVPEAERRLQLLSGDAASN